MTRKGQGQKGKPRERAPSGWRLGSAQCVGLFIHAKLLHNRRLQFHNCAMTEKEIVLETIRALPDDCSLDDIAERIEFMAAVQKGLDQLDKGEGIPHDEVKKQLASWLTS